MNKHTYISNLLLTILILGSCSIFEGPEDISNPMDPSDPDFVPPAVTFIQAPDEGETVDTCLVVFEWEGNQSIMNYSYRIDDQEWSEWSNKYTVEYPLLDEGSHSFDISSRYFNGVESDDPQVISFSVDDLTGPALTLNPRGSSGRQNYTTEIEISVVGVSDLALVKAVLIFNPDELSVAAVNVYDEESFLAINGGTVISFNSYDNVEGTITIEVGVATGDPVSISGSGAIAKIGFIPKIAPRYTGISFDISSEFRNPDNTTIQIDDFGNGGVYVQ
ncbi:MAG: hypothetical protein H8E14_10955 [Candidatus Marinimicrobia bacterium]|nr:hypothetical protein [Candidatus Neomarinimicrobiota bacterium]